MPSLGVALLQYSTFPVLESPFMPLAKNDSALEPFTRRKITRHAYADARKSHRTVPMISISLSRPTRQIPLHVLPARAFRLKLLFGRPQLSTISPVSTRSQQWAGADPEKVEKGKTTTRGTTHAKGRRFVVALMMEVEMTVVLAKFVWMISLTRHIVNNRGSSRQPIFKTWPRTFSRRLDMVTHRPRGLGKAWVCSRSSRSSRSSCSNHSSIYGRRYQR